MHIRPTIRERLRKALTSIVLICVVAVGARVAFAVDQSLKIQREALATAPFAQETGSIAYALVSGKGFSNPFRGDTGPTAWLAPVYPLLVAVAFKVFGAFTISAFFALVFLNTLFSSAVCIPLFHVGQRVAGIGVGSAAAWLWALFPGAIMVPFEWIWDTSLSALLAAILLWATLKLAESQRLWDWCGYGLLCGFALMTNPSLGSLLPPLLIWAAYRAWKEGIPWLARSSAALGIAFLCCVPWTIRNFGVFHRFIPLRSNFALELYIGNNENYDDKHPRYPGPITKERELVRYFRMGEVPFMDEERRKATKFIASHPRIELILFGQRFVAFWGGIPHPLENFMHADSLLVRVLLICAALTGIGALAGIVVLFWRHSPYAFPLAAFPVIFPLVYYVTHTSLRYRHPVDAIVVLLTVIALRPHQIIGANSSAMPS